MFKLVLEKAEEPEIKLPTPAGSSKRQESSRKKKIFMTQIINDGVVTHLEPDILEREVK